MHAAPSVRARGSPFGIQASMPETCAMEHLLGTRLGAKGWDYREPEERETWGQLDLMPHVMGSSGKHQGPPKEKAADQRRG